MLPDLPFETSHALIDGAWEATADSLPLFNPSTGETIGAIARCQQAEVDRAVRAAQTALDGAWGRMTATERGRILTRIGQLVLEEVETLTLIEALDVGKPLTQARNDAVALARYCEFYGGAADKVMGQTIPYLEGYTVYTLREPHGVTGHIVPGTTPCRSSDARSGRRWRWATPVF